MNMSHVRRLLVAGLALLLALVSAAPAFADPLKGSQAFIYNNPFTCDNGQTVRLVTPSGSAAAIQVIGTNQVLVPATGRNVGTVDGEVIFDETFTTASGNGQAKGLEGTRVTCVAHYQFEDEEVGLIIGTFSITGLLTPREN
ncbi:MAG TPA: hypothetical protein VFX76_10735 [Roseiflexaceae bacterium]|nr:hypothetical protein [Roseiflexaceae bacterium]